MTKIVLLDRDGVINHDSFDYIKSVDEFHFIPGSAQAIARLTQEGYRIGIATNQSGIARGLYDEATLAAIHHHMLTHLRSVGGDIAAIVYCPHLPEEKCACRKPKPGMLRTLSTLLSCELNAVPFVGDKETDVQAAEAVGAKPILIASTMHPIPASCAHVPCFESLAAYVDSLLTQKGSL